MFGSVTVFLLIDIENFEAGKGGLVEDVGERVGLLPDEGSLFLDAVKVDRVL